MGRHYEPEPPEFFELRWDCGGLLRSVPFWNSGPELSLAGRVVMPAPVGVLPGAVMAVRVSLPETPLVAPAPVVVSAVPVPPRPVWRSDGLAEVPVSPAPLSFRSQPTKARL